MEKQTTEQILKSFLQERGTRYFREGNYFVNAVEDLGGSKEDVRLLRYLVEVDGACALLDAGEQPLATRQTIYSQTVEKICDHALVSPELSNKICATFWRAVYGEDPPVRRKVSPPAPQPEQSPEELFERAWAYDQQGNMAAAIPLYRQAAEQGYAKAQNLLGWCYRNGRGVLLDLSEAVKWYRMAANQENAVGQFNLAWCLSTGTGVAQNHSEAVRLYRMSADQGNADAQCNLGSYLFNGTDVPKNISEAVILFQKSANQGNMYAQNWLSFCYESGEGIPKDLEQAVYWCRKAAAQGHADAKARLPELETQWRHYLLDSSTPSDSQTSRKITLYRPENTKAERWLLILGWALCLFYVICTLGGALYGISRIIRMGTFDELWSIIPFLLMIATYFILPILKRQYCLWHQTIEDWMPSRKLLRGLYALWATVAEVPAFSMAVFPLFQIIPDFPVLDPMIYFFFGAPFFSIYYFACFIWRRRMKKRG